MEYETPEVRASVPAISAVQSSGKDKVHTNDGAIEDKDRQLTGGYEDWE